MKTEQAVARWVSQTRFEDISPTCISTVKDLLLTDIGTLIGGAFAEGCEAVVNAAKEQGGKPEASILVHGGKVPAQQAAFANAMMARALDFCDSVMPGAHPGTAVMAAALASAELAGGAAPSAREAVRGSLSAGGGGPQPVSALQPVNSTTSVSGADFLAAVCVGTELAIGMNLEESQYDGFDPTGVCVPFGSTAAAARMMGLSEEETLNALGLAFCRCGGSFQANVDGVLAVRVIEGWAAETGVTCARLARLGTTGPPNFLDGVYGYSHLFGRDRSSGEHLLAGLGTDYQTDKLVFKKYPSCGGTQSSTQLILDLMAEENLEPTEVERVEITVPPYIYRLVGHPFKVGSNPKVNAQFSIRYCVANALLRKDSKLAHFEAEAVADPEVLDLADRIDVLPDAALDARGHTAADMRVVTKTGKEHVRSTDLGPGFPGNPLTKEQHLQRFRDCMEFSSHPLGEDRTAEIIHAIDRLEEIEDVRSLISLLLPR